MTASGWIFLILAWSAILGLFLFALLRTLRSGNKNMSGSKNQLTPDETKQPVQ